MTRHLLSVDDLSPGELHAVLDLAGDVKASPERFDETLAGTSVALLFEHPSTRTRVSFEAGVASMGAHVIFLGTEETQLGRGEPITDTARVLSGYVDAVAARLASHDDVQELAANASIPVVNALTDQAHPCQTMADLLTIREHVGALDGVTVAWVGDGNNVARSFAVGCAMAGVDLKVATPPGHELGTDVLARASTYGDPPTVTHDPDEAVSGADVVATDVWVSMGEDDRRDEKVAAFDGFQVNAALLAGAPGARVLHCLPAHRGEEITDAVLESDRALVWEQAKNRACTQQALLALLLDAVEIRSPA